jgi:hypothetical protein
MRELDPEHTREVQGQKVWPAVNARSIELALLHVWFWKAAPEDEPGELIRPTCKETRKRLSQLESAKAKAQAKEALDKLEANSPCQNHDFLEGRDFGRIRPHSVGTEDLNR